MREENYRQLKQQLPNFDSKYTEVVPLSRIKYNREHSQFRTKGHMLNMIPAFVSTMTDLGPTAFPPASVKKLPNGDYELMDGNTRALAAESAKTDLFVSFYHDAQLSPTATEWEDLQAKFNDHPRSSPNSDEDTKAYVSRQQQNGEMTAKVGFSYNSDEAKYISTAVGIYRKMLSNSGKSKEWWTRAIKNSLSGNIGVRYETYTKPQLFEMYQDSTDFAGTKIGEISGGEAVFPFRDVGDLNPQVMGSIATKEMDNSGIRHILVFAVGCMAGKDDRSIKTQRANISSWVEKVKAFYGWDIDVFFAPQIKSGKNKENMRKFISHASVLSTNNRETNKI